MLGCQTRNPLAQAHFANHPPRGGRPNVMIAAYDWSPQLPGEGFTAVLALSLGACIFCCPGWLR